MVEKKTHARKLLDSRAAERVFLSIITIYFSAVFSVSTESVILKASFLFLVFAGQPHRLAGGGLPHPEGRASTLSC